MKKLIALCLMFVLMVACLSLVACGDDTDDTDSTIYAAAADFFYSEDKGHTYGNGTKEYTIGDTVYMKVKAKVTSNKNVPEVVSLRLTIPNITALDAKYYDGQPITPTYDALMNITTYEFNIPASSNSPEFEFVFQFIPNAEAEVKMTLVFDDKVDPMYDKQNTVKFVTPEKEPEETPSETPSETPGETPSETPSESTDNT